MSEFKDLFSIQADDYAKYRPSYPDELFQFLSHLTSADSVVWDCGTGNGQAAIELAKRFSKIFATDPSEKQLSQAFLHPKIQYAKASAEASGLLDQSVSLVTVAQAFHWFQQDSFFQEVKRVCKPGGVLAIWTYGLSSINPDMDRAVHELYSNVLEGYWEKERKQVEEGYQNAMIPFHEIQTPSFQIQKEWNFSDLIGYLSTWSAVHTYIKKEGKNPVELCYQQMKKTWLDSIGLLEKKTVITWPLALRAFRL